MDVTYADIVARRVPLVPDEAVALVLAASRARKHTSDGDGALPPLDRIVLNGDGTLTLAPTDAADGDCVGQLARLLHALLVPDPSSRRPVPGPLLLVVARAAGEIDLPRPSAAEFERLLSRYGAADPMLLSAIHRRCVAAWSARRTEVGRRDAVRETARPVPVAMLDHSRARVHAAMAVAAAVLMVIVAVLSFYRWVELRTPIRNRVTGVTHDAVRPRATDRVGAAESLGSRANTEADDTRSSVPPPQASRGPSLAPTVVAARPVPVVAAASVGVDVFSPSYGEDRALLFHAGRIHSALMRLSFDRAGDPRVSTLVQDGAANFHPALSPDARWLAYDSDRDGIRGVYVAHPDGTDPQRVNGADYAAVPRWSPDGRKLAFIRAEPRRSRVWNVWVLDLTSRRMTRVSRHTVGQAWGASWFPDGNRIAYSVEDRLVIADLRGGARRVVRSPLRGHLVRTPAVSPDGRSIVFQVHHDGVWLLDVTSGAMHRVLADRAAEEFAWTPDGTAVVYHTRQRGSWSLWQLPVSRAGA